MAKYFSCPACKHRLPLGAMFQVRKDAITRCKSCGAKLKAFYKLPFFWGVNVGFFAVAVPGYLAIIAKEPFAEVMLTGGFFGMLALLAVCIHAFFTTRFVKD